MANKQASELRAIDLGECCRRIGISRRTGERLVAEGRFPIPELPRLGQEGSKRPRRTFSSSDVDDYLWDAATESVRHNRR